MRDNGSRFRLWGPWRLATAVVLAAWAVPFAEGRARADDPGPMPSPEQVEFFGAKVRPVLAGSCQSCHGAKKQSSGLRLDSREALIQGDENGPAVVPGDPDKSLLIQAVRRTHDDIKMPPKGRLPADAVDALASWVKAGAPWPKPPEGGTGKTAAASDDPSATHWAFRPVKPVSVPSVSGRGRVRSPVDAFILARLEKEGLSPSPEADRRTLIRRVTFDLTGLPPTPEEVEAFLRDDAPDAYERLVDRLLASPRYGERWGRHWLDVARYADTKGYVFQEERRYPFAYTYRDYVIRAFNADTPFDRFVVEQLAADRLAGAPGHEPRSLAALGFVTLGRRFLNSQPDIIDDRIDVVCRGLMGLTVACARCHDHKFDPIPTDDYYSLYGVFASSVEPADLPEIPAPVPEDLARDFRAKVAEKQKALDAFVAARRTEIEDDLRAHLGAYLRAAVDLDLNARNPKLDDRARADKLAPGRLRGVIVRWKNALDNTRGQPNPVLGPWHAFAALPADGFAARAADLAKTFLSDSGGSNPVNPVLARSFAENPPRSLGDVAERYGTLLAEAAGRWREAEQAGARALPQAEWDALRAVVTYTGPLAVNAETLPRMLDRAERNQYNKLNSAVASIKATHPGSPPRAMALADAPRPVEPRVFLRGNPNRPGKPVPRQFLKVIAGPGRKPFGEGSGRLELARAIASADNPLTARVFVNRVWLQHFGKGLVATPSDFGLRSEPPTHPELLDWLADDFVRHGWSVKHLHRRVLLSAAYRQQSLNRPECLARDPENRLVWKFNRRRLEFEAVRDALLAASGSLDPTMGGRAVPIFEAPFPPRRTVYGFIDRQNLEGTYRTFDFASPDASSPRRFVTTVPQQALFQMNSPFVTDQARRLAARPDLNESSPGEHVGQFYRLLFGREPDDRERSLGVAFVDRLERSGTAAPGGSKGPGLSPWGAYAQVLLLTNEFVFVD
jgi:hypothetical protein